LANRASSPKPRIGGDASDYESLSGLLHAYRTPVAIILFGIMVSMLLFFATLVGQTRSIERDFRSFAVARTGELDRSMATLDVELRQLQQAVQSGLDPAAAIEIFRAAELTQRIPVVRDMGIVEPGSATVSINATIANQVAEQVRGLMPRETSGNAPIILPLVDDNGRNSRFALAQRVETRPGAWAYVVSDFEVMLASPVGSIDPIWVVATIADRAPTYVLASSVELQMAAANEEASIPSALNSAPFLVRWTAQAPFSGIRAALLPRRSFLMQTDPLPWVVLFSALFATITIGAISLKDAQRADEVRREVARKTEALRQSNAIIAAKNAELERFASHASHDLQAPLRAMKGISSILVERQLDLDERSRDMLERINRGADRAQRLVQDLLTYTKAERQTAKIERIDTQTLIAEIEELLGAVIAEAGARVEWSLDTPIHADRFLLVRTLQNLVSNAVKYRRDVAPHVRVQASRAGDYVRISVTDNGIGIDKAYFTRIFEVFQRLHGSEAYEGTGIGLALCQRAVELHGGDIGVSSTPGEGSCFTIRLPASLADQVANDSDEAVAEQSVSNDR
jgi:signal transduction histidine kinase